MFRRTFLKHGTGAAAAAAIGLPPAGATAAGAGAALPRRVRPGDAGWPSAGDWARLKQAVGGRLVPVTAPLESCKGDAAACADMLKKLENPFFIQDQPGATQTVGWVDGWTSKPSVYAVAAETVGDVVAAVNFAREKNLRLVVKGGGHSYLGQSNAPDSLLLWTRGMDSIAMREGFVAQGGAGQDAPQTAVEVAAGAKFLGLYDFVTTRHGRYVQGGGCTSVGVGGHIQTGGFGSFSKGFGMTAAGMLEAEIVTADGQVRIANRHVNPDLFFALRGGGASYGVITRLVLRTHALPATFGVVNQTVRARDDAAFRRLVAAFLDFCAAALIAPHWGEQVTVGGDNRLDIAVSFQGIDEAGARAAWAPFWAWLAANASDLAEAGTPRVIAMPARHWWDADYRRRHLPQSIVMDDRPEAKPGAFWWAGNASEVGIFLTGYESAWLPAALLAPSRRGDLAQALFDASRHADVGLHLNKGLAGADEAVRRETRALAVNPVAADAFALAIVATTQEKVHPGLSGREPDLGAGRNDARRVAAAAAALRKVAPDGGGYCSEANYFADDWRTASWGPHYPRLLAIKQKYDPTGLFYGHHWVGSEFWQDGGFTPLA
ncbi:MAG: FAD-binding oxidoreductase [Rhodospirillales bacterium]